MELVKVVVTFHLLIQPTVGGQDQVCLSHALIPQAQVIFVGERKTQRMWFELTDLFDYLSNLKLLVDHVKNHLSDDVTHLSQSKLISFEVGGRYLTYVTGVSDARSLDLGCLSNRCTSH
jgi:hypothetical protein